MKAIKLTQFFALLIALIVVSLPAHADNIDEDGRVWLNINMKMPLPIKGLNAYLEIQLRWREEGSEYDQTIIRPAIFYDVSPKSSVWLGYARVISHSSTKPNTHENRLWQQFSYSFDPIAEWKIASRTRLEERSIEGKDDIGYRLRQMLKFTRPLSLENISIILSDELFLNANSTDWGAASGFDQNRAFIGLGYKLNKHNAFEIGYLNQFVNTRKVDRENHVLSTTWAINF